MRCIPWRLMHHTQSRLSTTPPYETTTRGGRYAAELGTPRWALNTLTPRPSHLPFPFVVYQYPKVYYWFSPLPLPVAWFEFFYVVRTRFGALSALVISPLSGLRPSQPFATISHLAGSLTYSPTHIFAFESQIILTTLFSMAMNAYVNPLLTTLYLKAGRGLTRVFSGQQDVAEKERGPEDIVKACIKELVGDESFYDPDSDLSAAGVQSVGLPVFVSLLNRDDRLSIKVSDVVGLNTLGELVALLDGLIRQAETAAGVGEDVI